MRFRLLALSGLLLAATSCEPSGPTGPSDPATETYAASLGVDIASMTKVDANLYYKDLVVGTGAVAAANKVVTYSGFLTNGTSFDSGTLDPTPLNDANLIAGWVVGIPGMKVGGKRKLVIGSNYAYGSRGNGSIPGNATLVFDVELKEVR
jgi:FKBP-type peptidyl-prolyl cis-trans isomerase FkpA